jgi:syntenin-1
VNGQNGVGVKDKEISKIIDDGGQSPSFLYSHIMKSMSCSLGKKMMDHSILDFM